LELPANCVSFDWEVTMSEMYDVHAATIVAQMPAGPRLAVVGSTSFYKDDSESLCRAISHQLAQRQDLVLITGGMTGVGQAFAEAAIECRGHLGMTENVYHLLPRGVTPCKRGITLHAGADYDDRRELLGRVADIYLVIEGGPGTEHEVSVASSRGVPIIAVAISGGHAAECYAQLTCPVLASSDDWTLLNDQSAEIGNVAAAVDRIVTASHSSR
jgi:predicted Rossmann-fold nucleotide-binding protein